MAKLLMPLVLSSFIFITRSYWWTIVVSLLVDIWCVANLIYYKTYDAVLTADREQGLKDFLELSQGNGVAYTTGRELICTAPFSAESFRESIYLAKDILKNRERYDEARSNPLPKLFIDKKEDNKKRHEPN